MRRAEIRIAGLGDQSLMLCATIIGRAASIYGGSYATLTQTLGPEKQTGASSAHIILSAIPITLLYATASDVLVAMSQEGYERFAPELRPGGELIVEKDLVRLSGNGSYHVLRVPATRLAKELGEPAAPDIVMLGFFSAVTSLLGPSALRHAVADFLPGSARDLSLCAFQVGYEYATLLVTVPQTVC